MKNNNPVFDFLEEGMPAIWILGNMGFETLFDSSGYIEDDDFFDEYEENADAWLAAWNPPAPDGFTLVATYAAELGPMALFVKPTTPFAERLLAFGVSEAER